MIERTGTIKKNIGSPTPNTERMSNSAIMIGDLFYSSLLPNGGDRNKEGFCINSAVRVGITSRKHTDDVAFVVDRGTRVTSH